MPIDSCYFIPGFGFKSDVGIFLKKHLPHLIFIDVPVQYDLNLSMIIKNIAMSIAPASIVYAWSFGGLLALLTAKYYPEKIKKLVLIHSSPRFLAGTNWAGINLYEFEKFIHLFHSNKKAWKMNFLKWICFPYLKKIDLMESYFDISLAEYWFKYIYILMHLDLRAFYPILHCEILHIYGEKDLLVASNADFIKSLYSRSKFYWIQSGGHIDYIIHPFHIES